MEVARQQAYIDGYQREASHALQRFMAGERSEPFLHYTLNLLSTYLQIPRPRPTILAADATIVKLAQACQFHLSNRGFWHQLLALWPSLIELAAQLPQPILHAELVKHCATIKDRQGDGEEANQRYRHLIHAAHFSQLSLEIQADVLHQAGTALVWQGKLTQAQTWLNQVLTLTEQSPIDQIQRNQMDCYGVRASFEVTPLWESKAYALNQLGNVAMFQGKFAQAEQIYIACWNILNEHGEADNLACVAHQALGRLWLHWRRPRQAIAILEKGLAIRQRRQEREGVAINSIYLAAALIEQGQLKPAEALLTEALPITRVIGNRRDRGLCHLYFGQLELQQGKRAAAFAQWRQALSYLQTVHTPLVEQRIFIQYSPCLLSIGERALFRAIIRQLKTSAREQCLQRRDLRRLLICCR